MYLRSAMGQTQFDYAMILAIHKSHVDSLELNEITEGFVEGHEYHLHFLGKFKWLHC